MGHAGRMGEPGTPLLGADGAALRALVVEDEPNLADVLVRMLTFDGWVAAQARTGRGRAGPRARVPPRTSWCWT